MLKLLREFIFSIGGNSILIYYSLGVFHLSHFNHSFIYIYIYITCYLIKTMPYLIIFSLINFLMCRTIKIQIDNSLFENYQLNNNTKLTIDIKLLMSNSNSRNLSPTML